MKTIIIAAGIALVVGGFVLHYTPSTTVEYKQEVVEKIVEPEWATNQEAVEAAQAVIKRQKLEAELLSLNSQWVTTTAEYESKKEAYLDKKEELEKELGTY